VEGDAGVGPADFFGRRSPAAFLNRNLNLNLNLISPLGNEEIKIRIRIKIKIRIKVKIRIRMNADVMKPFAAILVLLALAGCSTDSRSPAFKPGSAIVRSVLGDVQYGNGGVWKRLRVNLELTNGTQIRTGRECVTYLQIGRAATVKLEDYGELELTAIMVRHYSIGRDATRTALELRKGTILGKVKQLSSESSFQVRSGGVTLEVHGTDFQMSADGRVEILTGDATVTSGGQTYQLADEEYFDPRNNEVGKLPQIIEVYPGLPVVSPWRPPSGSSSVGSSSLSPFERGLENARHGLPATGN